MFAELPSTAHGAIHVSFGLLFFECLAFVAYGFSTGQRDGDLGDAAFVEIHPHGDEREAALFDLGFDLRNLVAMKQQFSPGEGVVRPGGAVGIRGDVAADKPHLSALHPGVGFIQ